MSSDPARLCLDVQLAGGLGAASQVCFPCMIFGLCAGNVLPYVGPGHMSVYQAQLPLVLVLLTHWGSPTRVQVGADMVVCLGLERCCAGCVCSLSHTDAIAKFWCMLLL